MKIVHKKTDGIATDLRLEEDDYVLQAGEVSATANGELPDIETLHDSAKKQERDKARKQIITLEDVISVLSPGQQAQLEGKRKAK